MSGTVTVLHTPDWLTPFEVHLVPEKGQGQPGLARFAAAAKAQEYAVAMAEEWDATLVYKDCRNLDALEVPTNGGNRKTSREISPAEFQQRYTRICSKCKRAKRLTEFGSVLHRNRTTRREVFHGYTERCLACGGDQ